MRRVAAAAIVAIVVAACGTEQWSFDSDAASSGDDGGAGCTSDGDCKLSSLHCDTRSRQCVECIDDTQCTNKSYPRCDAALHRCIQCGNDNDCGSGEVCDPTAQRCMRSCAEGGACPSAAPICVKRATDSVCVACRNNDDCEHNPDGSRCNVASGQCVACTEDSQCNSYEQPRCDKTSGRCVRCLSSSDCPHDDPICDPYQHTCTGGTNDDH